MNSLTIAVHGATGVQGAPVVRHLKNAGHRVRAVVRRPGNLPTGVEPAPADLLDLAALTTAYAGVDAVVLQLPLVFDDVVTRQAKTVLAALGSAGVPRVVFNTGSGIPDGLVGVPHVDARALLCAELPSVVATASIVSPAATYMENLAGPWSAPLIAAGQVCYPLPAEAPVPWVAAADVAAVIGELVTAPATTTLVGGPEDLTGDQVAAALGDEVRWLTVTPEEYERMLRPHLGAATAAGIAAAYAAPATPSATMARRGPTTLRAWAALRMR